MTIDEAIKHCLEVAEKNETLSEWGERNKVSCLECAADHRQLAEWLTELKEAKRLLKAAVEGFEYIKPYTSRCDGHCNNCPFENEGWCRIDWRYADEALKLIGEDGEQNG